tara:strand:- start:1263 stop:2174 length:912 start_codon:yes stop_codon:yes gene_type:complete
MKLYSNFELIENTINIGNIIFKNEEFIKCENLYIETINKLYLNNFFDFNSSHIYLKKIINDELKTKRLIFNNIHERNCCIYKLILSNPRNYNLNNVKYKISEENISFIKNGYNIEFNFINVPDSKGTIIAIGGTGGGYYGPAYIYDDLAVNASLLNLSILRVNVIPNYQVATFILNNAILKNIDKIKGKPVILMGWSMGGATIVNTAKFIVDNNLLKINSLISFAGQTHGIEPIKYLNIPIYILHGDNDTVLNKRCADIIYKLAKNPKQKIILNGASHFMIEKQNEVKKYVYKWIEESFSFKN